MAPGRLPVTPLAPGSIKVGIFFGLSLNPPGPLYERGRYFGLYERGRYFGLYERGRYLAFAKGRDIWGMFSALLLSYCHKPS
jgi:hypothetical protein